VHEGSGFAVTAASVAAADKPICDAGITFRLMDFPNPEFRARMEESAERLAFPREALAHG
jgi:3-hydroxyacyl-[acyl-carrier-protein] dehydratase